MINVGGMVGLGKTTVAEILAREFNSKVFYENVDNNPILPLFYTLSEEELLKNRFPFLLQLEFLHSRAESIREAKAIELSVLDRSLAEDEYFATINHQLGRISDLELQMYKKLKKTVTADFEEATFPKSPELLVYLKASFETVLFRIGIRGRDFEQDEKLIDYYRKLWEGYDDWVLNEYKESDVIVIDMDKLDVVKRHQDAQYVLDKVKEKLGIS
ncbi:deoxynucleoside kinase [[Brevibacterium] frigoritolerans]|nr:deoxynucleoside kinase [Peribacillus frigoritolerans]